MTITMRQSTILSLCLFALFLDGIRNQPASADDPPSNVGPVLRLLKSGRLPDERIGTVVELICNRGNEHDLAFVFERCLAEDGFRGKTRTIALGYLADAAQNRKVKPAGDLNRLNELIDSDADAQQLREVIRLAGLWKVTSLGSTLQKLALDPNSSSAIREAAIDGLVVLSGDVAKKTFEKLAASEQPIALRFQAVAAMASVDVGRAAELAALALADATTDDNPSELFAAFLNRKGGVEKLANAITGVKLSTDVAKLGLRYMYSVGRNDATLSDALSQAAGVAGEQEQWTVEQMQQLAGEVLGEGSAARGEEIFRRADLSCMKCHSISKAGGNIGPDLAPLGGSSPIDYVIRSILYPNQAIKEQYKTVILITLDGKVLTGIPVDRNNDRVVLKLADGKQVTVPVDDIDEEAEGQSLMPKGLTKFLTRAELIDLVRFLSELGKPGEYAIRTEPIVRRWRSLEKLSDDLVQSIPDPGTFELKVLNAPAQNWKPLYAKVSGRVPLGNPTNSSGQHVTYIQGEFEVTAAGEVGINIDATVPVFVWIGTTAYDSQKQIVSTLEPGRYPISIRAETGNADNASVAVQLFKPKQSTAEFDVVHGQ